MSKEFCTSLVDTGTFFFGLASRDFVTRLVQHRLSLVRYVQVFFGPFDFKASLRDEGPEYNKHIKCKHRTYVNKAINQW